VLRKAEKVPDLTELPLWLESRVLRLPSLDKSLREMLLQERKGYVGSWWGGGG
jgi:hypothetical protein